LRQIKLRGGRKPPEEWARMRIIVCILSFLVCFRLPAWAQTEQDLAVILSACQFFAGSPFTAAQRDVIVANARSDFSKDPAGARAQVGEFRQLGNQLSQMSNPVQMIAVRQTGLYYLWSEKKAGRSDPASEIVLSKARPLAMDSKNQVLLLSADLDGVVHYLSFLRQSQGGSPWSEAESQQFKHQVIQSFAQLPDENKSFFLGGQVFWSVISHNLQRMNQQRQAELRQRIAQQQQVPMSMDTYRILSNMSRAQHLTTMNILENMGGSGDYWETVERPSW